MGRMDYERGFVKKAMELGADPSALARYACRAHALKKAESRAFVLGLRKAATMYSQEAFNRDAANAGGASQAPAAKAPARAANADMSGHWDEKRFADLAKSRGWTANDDGSWTSHKGNNFTRQQVLDAIARRNWKNRGVDAPPSPNRELVNTGFNQAYDMSKDMYVKGRGQRIGTLNGQNLYMDPLGDRFYQGNARTTGVTDSIREVGVGRDAGLPVLMDGKAYMYRNGKYIPAGDSITVGGTKLTNRPPARGRTRAAGGWYWTPPASRAPSSPYGSRLRKILSVDDGTPESINRRHPVKI